MVYDLSIAEVVFIGTREGEGDFSDIPQEALTWRDGFKGFKEKNGFFVKWNGEYGFLFIQEYVHDGQNFEPDMKEAVKSGLKNEKIFHRAKGIAMALCAQRIPYDIFFGEKTGPFERHEVAVFIPYGANNSAYVNVMNELSPYLYEKQAA